MKKFLIAVLSVLMLFSMATVNVLAEKDDPQAIIGETYYSTLNDAIKDVKTGERTEIVLLKDVSDGEGIFISSNDNKNIVLDLGGHTYAVKAPSVGSAGTETQGLHLEKGNTIEIKNGTISVASGAENVKMLIQNYCDLTLDGVTLDGTNLPGEVKRYVLSNNNGNVTIKNSTIIARDGDAAFDADYNFGYPGYGELNVTVENSVINGLIEYTPGSKTGKLRIKSGSFINLECLKYIDSTNDHPAEIKLLNDVNNAQGMSVPSGTYVIVDFDKHTYELNRPGAGSTGTQTQGFQLLKDSAITFINGTIKCAADNKDFTWQKNDTVKGIAMIIQNYADLTLDNMFLDGLNIAHNGNNTRYVLSNNSGQVVITNSSNIYALPTDFAFDSCKNGDYVRPVVNVDNSIINGRIEATGGVINLNEGTKVYDQLRVGENKDGGSTGSEVTINQGATITREEYPVVVFGSNELSVNGKVESTTESTDDTAAIATNGNAYNGGSEIYINVGAEVSSKRGSGIYMPNGSLTINGGTITGPTAVYFKSKVLAIYGGTLIGNGQKKDYVFNGNGGNPTGDALVVDNCNYPSGITTPIVAGGKFKSINASPIGSYKGNGKDTILTGFVGGGIFNKEFDSSLVVSGKHIIANTDAETLNEYPYAVGELNIPEKTVTETSKKSDVPSYPGGSEKEKVADNLDKMSIDLDSEALKLVSNKVNESFVNNARQRIGLQTEEDLDVNVRTVLKTEVLSTNLTPASASKKTFKIDITPVYEILIKKVGATGDGTKVDEGLINVNRSVMVKVYLPEGFATTGEHVWIKHWLHDGSSKVCEVVVANDTDGNYVEFENHYGFSAFEFFLEQVFEDAAPNHDSTSHYHYLVPNTGIR